MSQKLIPPLPNCKLTASWKTTAYAAKFGLTHYGADLINPTGAIDGNRKVYASGIGVVVACGYDNVVGNVIAVLYLNAYNRVTGRTEDVIIRYYHLASIAVSKWRDVTNNTVLGTYGNTGSMQMSPHLHIEADKDIAYPLYSPTVKSSNLIKGTAAGANDKTMTNPLDWFCVPVWSTAGDAYVRPEDKILT